MTNPGALRDYYNLAKPRMVYGNTLVAAAAFIYASQAGFNWLLFACTMLGLMCTMASACAFNNYADRRIDARMARTKNRALADGRVSGRGALVFAAALLIVGTVFLFFTNLLALGVALAGWVAYVLAYTPLKPKTRYALFVGALAGATPPVVGYVAVANTFDVTAMLLFMFLFIWQMPHFLAISVYRHEEYAAAGVPLFMEGPYSPRQKKWGRAIFYLSLVVLLAWCVLLILHK